MSQESVEISRKNQISAENSTKPAKAVETSRKSEESVESLRKNGNVETAWKTEKSVESSRKSAKAVETSRKSEESVETVRIHTQFITLQDLLKLTGAVDTGGEAKIRVQNGEAQVNGVPCLQRGKKLRPGDTVSFRGKSYAVGHGQ